MVGWCYLISFWFFIQLSDSKRNTNCPFVPSGCRCSSKRKITEFKITCSNLKHVSFRSLPSNISLDIDLSNNMLTEINDTMFPYPNKIRKLNLKDNHIKTIDDNTFQGFYGLKKLDISKNYLLEITDKTFAGLDKASLVTLDLRENQILKIVQKAFERIKISKLLLSRQMNVYGKRATIIAYQDFLSLSLIQSINLDDSRLLCDCSLKWLTTWARSSVVSPQTKCHYPKELKNTFVKDLTSDSWECDKYRSTFTLPHFGLLPASNQMLFENDTIMLICHTTWVDQTFIVWNINGHHILKTKNRIYIRHYSNLTSGLYFSTIKIKRLQQNDTGKLTCRLKVYSSGDVDASINLNVIGRRNAYCPPVVSQTERGMMSWPTALMGAKIKVQCPYGGLNTAMASRSCNNGNWSQVSIAHCFFGRGITKSLQEFYEISRSHDTSNKLVAMSKRFTVFFKTKYHQIETKYDFYFIYKTLNEIMLAYKERNVRDYSGFFWGSIGLITQKHNRLKSMGESVYGESSDRRFLNLLESFVKQESRKSNNYFAINNHRSMAALSFLQKSQTAIECNVVSPSYISGNNLKMTCSRLGNLTLYQASVVMLQIAVAGLYADEVHITSLVYATDTFFHSSTKRHSKFSIVSPVVGLQITSDKTSRARRRRDIAEPTLITFKNSFEHHNPKLVFWNNAKDKAPDWTESKDCSRLEKSFKNLTQFKCRFLWTNNMTYFALTTENDVMQAPVIMKANYLEAIIYVAAVFCCLLLVCTLVVYALFRQLRFNRSDAATLMNLCLVFIISELIFACGIHKTDNLLICKGVAVALHYFLLCALLWLGCGGVVLIRLLKKKDQANVNEYDPVLKYYLIGWGLPLIICGITIAYDRSNYGADHYCWLTTRASLSAFICPGGLIVLVDIIILGYLHALINRIYPEPLEPISKEQEEIFIDKCNPKSCKYKAKPVTVLLYHFPKRDELLLYLRGSLFVLLLFCLSFTCVVMMYSYQATASKYLYYLFCYTSALCNILMGVTVLFFHCIKRNDVQTYVKDFLLHLFHVKAATMETEEVKQSESPMIAVKPAENRCNYEISDVTSDFNIDNTHGVYGLSDQLQSEGSHVIATVRVETCQSYEGRGESVDQLDDNVPKFNISNDSDVIADHEAINNSQNNRISHTSAQSHSEMSEADRNSIHNSIGECSLTSSKTPKRVRPINLDIPENLKSFVPEHWRPARRRRSNKGSYYPYFNTDISASVAYSSNASSVASTTVGGVPLYINKKRAANNLAMYTDLFNHNKTIKPQLNRMGPMRQPLPQSLPPQPVPQPGFQGMHLGSLVPYTHYQPENLNRLPTNTPYGALLSVTYEQQHNSRPHSPIDINESKVIEEEDEQDEEECLIKVAPILYIPVPHVTKKQFILCTETSV